MITIQNNGTILIDLDTLEIIKAYYIVEQLKTTLIDTPPKVLKIEEYTYEIRCKLFSDTQYFGVEGHKNFSVEVCFNKNTGLIANIPRGEYD